MLTACPLAPPSPAQAWGVRLGKAIDRTFSPASLQLAYH